MKPAVTELIRRIVDANFFSRIGQELSGLYKEVLIPVFSWKEALQCCGSTEWRNYTLEHRNSLTMFLQANAPERLQVWNETIVEVKQSVLPALEHKVSTLGQLNELGKKSVFTSLVWDVLGAAMEVHHGDIRNPGF